jgi:hypothetical protein
MAAPFVHGGRKWRGSCLSCLTALHMDRKIVPAGSSASMKSPSVGQSLSEPFSGSSTVTYSIPYASDGSFASARKMSLLMKAKCGRNVITCPLLSHVFIE